ncbi:MAG TPA: PH domain-containing protein [bacterium]|nr:PH domain-containing protein [bacterium]
MANLADRLHNPRPGEYIILYIHRHWIILFASILKSLSLIVLPIIVYWGLILQGVLEWQGLSGLLFILGSSLFYLYVWLFLFNSLLDHYLDVWIVTNERIINVEQINLFSRLISEKQLDKMQDITVVSKGFWATIFNYGDVHIQTAGSVERFVFKQIPNPRRTVHAITDAAERYRIKFELDLDDDEQKPEKPPIISQNE